MKKPSGPERRLYPRIEESFPLKVSANGYGFSTTTQNVSCLGAYCHIDKYIPPFTKIMVKLNLPSLPCKEREDSALGGCDVECKGVVVRSIDGSNGGFNVAIYFNAIKETQRRKIADYLAQFLPKG
ncbi:MAG: PilZ domain-containing protein [Candidatus Omnitrophota bacterium]